MSFLDYVFPENKNRKVLHELAIDSANAVQNLFKLYKEGDFKIDLANTSFTRIFPNDPNSPAIHWVADDKLIIRYPPFSTPYHHAFKDKCKFVQCVSGVIYDKNSNTKLFPGDQIKIEPDHNFEPYTEKETCYLVVCISDCKNLWNQVCG